MSGEIIATLLSMATYVLCVILPAVPALIIFKLAPNSGITVNGPLSKLNLRATGAIGAYLAFFIISAFVIQDILDKIEMIPKPTMLVQAKVELVDSNGSPVDDPTALSTMHVLISPKMHSVEGAYTTIKVPGAMGKRWPHPFITFCANNYMNKTIDLCAMIRNNKVRFEREENYVELLEPIQLVRQSEEHEEYKLQGHMNEASGTCPPTENQE